MCRNFDVEEKQLIIITVPKSEVESSNAEVTRVPSRMRKAGDDSAVEVFPIIHEFVQLSQIRTKTTCAHPAKNNKI